MASVLKGPKQYFPVVLFIMKYKDKILSCAHMNESYWVVLYCSAIYMLCTDRYLTFESVDEIVIIDH